MALRSIANILSDSDHIGYQYVLLRNAADASANSGSPTVGTAQYIASLLTASIANTPDIPQQQDLDGAYQASFQQANVEALAALMLSNAVKGLNDHCGNRGSAVSSTIVRPFGLKMALEWYNSTPFSNLVTPAFATVYALPGVGLGDTLPASVVMSPAIIGIAPIGGSNPLAVVNTNGMGSIAVGGSFTAGAAVTNATYSEVNIIGEVTTNLTGGAGAATPSVAGTDNTGALTTTWAGSIPQNQVSAVATTLGAAVTTPGRVASQALGSTTGIVAGSYLSVDAGTPNQETIFVEAVSGSNITAVFTKTHSNGAAVAGRYSFVLTPTPSGRRCRSVSGITPNWNSHTAGAWRVIGVQDRIGY